MDAGLIKQIISFPVQQPGRAAAAGMSVYIPVYHRSRHTATVFMLFLQLPPPAIRLEKRTATNAANVAFLSEEP